ncbi:hypothetical protein QFZ86_001731, partial [Pseudomonas plecoglossicida]
PGAAHRGRVPTRGLFGALRRPTPAKPAPTVPAGGGAGWPAMGRNAALSVYEP